MGVYLINENTPEAGVVEYDDAIAEVLLRESEDKGWHVADPETGEPLPDAFPKADWDAIPEDTSDSASVDNPNPGESADLPKE